MWWWYVIIILYILGVRDKKTETIKISEKWLIVFVLIQAFRRLQERKSADVSGEHPCHLSHNGYIGTKWAKHQKTKRVKKRQRAKPQCCKCWQPSIHRYTVCSQHSSSLIRAAGKEKGKKDVVLSQHTFFSSVISHISLLISENKQDWPLVYFR